MKNRDNLILGGIFLFLLVFYVLQKTVFKPSERSFREQLTQFDPESVDRMEYERNGNLIEFTKTDKGWFVASGEKKVKARQESIEPMIKALAELQTKQLVSRNPEKWSEYELDDTQARIYRIYSGDDELAGLHIGRFDFDQQGQTATSYARLTQEDDIYAIDGFVSMTVSRDFNAFRENRLLNFNTQDIQSIELISGDLEESLEKSIDGQWVFNSTTIDSTQMAGYLNRLSNLRGSDFNDDFMPGTGFGVIQSLQLNDTLKLDTYLNPSGGFVLTSTQNDAYFNSDSTGVYKQVFLDLEEMLVSGE